MSSGWNRLLMSSTGTCNEADRASAVPRGLKIGMGKSTTRSALFCYIDAWRGGSPVSFFVID